MEISVRACVWHTVERPLHSMEIVADVIKKWSTWPEQFCHGICLCAKHNYVYVNIGNVVSSVLQIALLVLSG